MHHQIEKFIDFTGRAVSWLTLGMVLTTFLVVLLRYLFDTGSIALQESISYMHALVFLIGAAYTLKHNEHVRVDIFYHKLNSKQRALIDLIGNLLVLLPVMFFILWISWEYVFESWSVLESSRETGGLPGLFLLKSCILLMAGLLMLQSFALIIRSFNTLNSKESN
ncbi:MAG: TRAP transporter small permease subunit [Gammaproteobacteria bacterium]|nr:TRAP transporter small permease subunit [Gammaproteobacteria bacterium]MCW9005169.1 TRAP transporter small permease subunit [Gammaproteobacteria bacterium]MCW9057195.1 TRAP transporter small permease subunit [Gammaproteobacteria bacterium]